MSLTHVPVPEIDQFAVRCSVRSRDIQDRMQREALLGIESAEKIFAIAKNADLEAKNRMARLLRLFNNFDLLLTYMNENGWPGFCVSEVIVGQRRRRWRQPVPILGERTILPRMRQGLTSQGEFLRMRRLTSELPVLVDPYDARFDLYGFEADMIVYSQYYGFNLS